MRILLTNRFLFWITFSFAILFLLTYSRQSMAHQVVSTKSTQPPATQVPILVQTSNITTTRQILEVEKLQQEVEQLKTANRWNIFLNLVTALATPVIALVSGVFAFRKLLMERRQEEEKRLDQRQQEEERRSEERLKLLDQRQQEEERRSEERFQAAVEGLKNHRSRVRAISAIILRTFLEDGYEKFYVQVVNLAVNGLRFGPPIPENELSNPPTPEKQALVFAIKQGYWRAREEAQKINPTLKDNISKEDNPNLLDATAINLVNNYCC